MTTKAILLDTILTSPGLRAKALTLAGEMLREYAERLSCDGCNDWLFPQDWSTQDKEAFVQAFHAWNGDPEEFDPKRLVLGNSSVAGLLSAVLKQAGECASC